jgi:hypothetical protein
LTFDSALATIPRSLCQAICIAEEAQRWPLLAGQALVSFAVSESSRLSLRPFYSDLRSGKMDM